EIAKSRRTIEFSGAAGQVESAFHTELHYYDFEGERHVANATGIAIPEALADLVDGPVALHDFFSRPLHHTVTGRQPSPAPNANLTGGSHAMGPYDFAAIYNVAALWN